jgi:hypothetical protein
MDAAFASTRASGKIRGLEHHMNESIAASTETATQPAASRKLIAEWTTYCDVAIWEDRCFTIRLYADRAVYKGSTVKWSNNSGSLDHFARRITGPAHAALLKLDADGVEDGEDYTDEAFEIVAQYD